jgi:hypothetical protein
VKPCVEWKHARSKGYGVLYDPKTGRNFAVHRWVWACANGAIPRDKVVMHKCDNKACYRLEHLQLGTQRENLQDMARKGRSCATLSEWHVRGIRGALFYGMRQRDVAKLFGTNQRTVCKINRGTSVAYS